MVENKRGRALNTRIHNYIVSRRGLWKPIQETERRIVKCYLNREGSKRSSLLDWIKSVTPNDLVDEFNEHEIMELLLEEE